MKFKNWLIDRLGTTNNEETLKEHGSYIATFLNVIEKVYDAFKDTPLIDLMSVYTIDDLSIIKSSPLYRHKNVYFLTIKDDNALIDLDLVFNYIKYLNSLSFLDTMTIEDFKDGLLLGNAKENEFFYCIVSMNPSECDPEYVVSVREVFKDTIGGTSGCFTNINELYNSFKEAMKDPKINSLITSNFINLGILTFKSQEELNKYCKDFELLRERLNKIDTILDSMTTVNDEDIKIINLEQAEELGLINSEKIGVLKSIKQDYDNDIVLKSGSSKKPILN